MANVTMVFDAETAKAVQAFVTLENRQEALRRKSEQVASAGHSGGDALDRAFTRAGKSIVNIAAGLGVATSGVALLHQAWSVVSEDIERTKDAVRSISDARMELAMAPDSGGKAQREALNKQAAEYGITDIGALYRTRAAFQQSTSGMDSQFSEAMWRQYLKATQIGVPLQPDVMAGVMRLGRVAESRGQTPKQLFNLMEFVGDTSKTSPAEIAKYGPGAISAAVEGGATMPQGAALLALASQGPVNGMREVSGDIERFIKTMGELPRQVTERGKMTPRGAALQEIGVAPGMDFGQAYETVSKAYQSGKMTPDMMQTIMGDTGPVSQFLLKNQPRYVELAKQAEKETAGERDLISEKVTRVTSTDETAADELRRKQAQARQNAVRLQDEGKVTERDASRETREAKMMEMGMDPLARFVNQTVSRVPGLEVSEQQIEASKTFSEERARRELFRGVERQLSRLGRSIYGDPSNGSVPSAATPATPQQEAVATASRENPSISAEIIAAAVKAGVQDALKAGPLSVTVQNAVKVDERTQATTLPRAPGGE